MSRQKTGSFVGPRISEAPKSEWTRRPTASLFGLRCGKCHKQVVRFSYDRDPGTGGIFTTYLTAEKSVSYDNFVRLTPYSVALLCGKADCRRRCWVFTDEELIQFIEAAERVGKRSEYLPPSTLHAPSRLQLKSRSEHRAHQVSGGPIALR
jgi:hypothetical protein